MSNDASDSPNNGAVITIYQINKAVVSSAAQSEIGALFINCREAIPAGHALEEMGHKQPPTPMQTNNTTARGVVTKNIAEKVCTRSHWHLLILYTGVQSHHYHSAWIHCKATSQSYREHNAKSQTVP